MDTGEFDAGGGGGKHVTNSVASHPGGVKTLHGRFMLYNPSEKNISAHII